MHFGKKWVSQFSFSFSGQFFFFFFLSLSEIPQSCVQEERDRILEIRKEWPECVHWRWLSLSLSLSLLLSLPIPPHISTTLIRRRRLCQKSCRTLPPSPFLSELIHPPPPLKHTHTHSKLETLLASPPLYCHIRPSCKAGEATLHRQREREREEKKEGREAGRKVSCCLVDLPSATEVSDLERKQKSWPVL